MENLKVVIRSATSQDVSTIAVLAATIWRRHYPGIISLEQIEYMLGRMYDHDVICRELASGIRYDLLLVNDQPAGFCAYGPAEEIRTVKLHKIYLCSDWQRQGFGGELLRRVAEVARSDGYQKMILTVNRANVHAIAAYEKHGFTKRAAVVADIGHGFVMDDFLMEKWL